MKTLLHVDMDAFFASVELLSHPEWRGRPLVIGSGPHERGVVSTCSYEARAFGIHSARPSRTAYQLCPSAIFAPPDMAHYQAVSDQIFTIFEHYTPYVEAVSVDEAFLDITGSIHLFGSAQALAEQLRAEIRRECGVTCSVGVAPNRLLAKIGSEFHKPDGLTMMPSEPRAIAEFLSPKPLRILWGIGEKTAALLLPYGITTCGDLQRLDLESLVGILGSRENAARLRDYALGIASDEVEWQPAAEKSVSREYTFDEDCGDRETVRAQLLELVIEVGQRFRSERRWAKTARLKLRDEKFNTFTRQMPFAHPARDDLSFREAALKLFDEGWRTLTARAQAVRLVGFGVTNLQTTADDGELRLFVDAEDERRRRRERLSETLDVLRGQGKIAFGVGATG